VRYLVEAHEATVRASSRGRGQGAEFVVELPCAEALAAAPKTRARARGDEGEPLASLAGAKVLCVDDGTDTLQLLALILGDRGAVVRTAGSVDEAMKLLPSFAPDVVVSDLAMPRSDGFDLIRRIRAMAGPLAGVPAVATTAYARAEDADRALQAGFTRHMAKPLDADALASLISELTAQSRSALRPGQRCGASQNGPSRPP